MITHSKETKRCTNNVHIMTMVMVAVIVFCVRSRIGARVSMLPWDSTFLACKKRRLESNASCDAHLHATLRVLFIHPRCVLSCIPTEVWFQQEVEYK